MVFYTLYLTLFYFKAEVQFLFFILFVIEFYYYFAELAFNFKKLGDN